MNIQSLTMKQIWQYLKAKWIKYLIETLTIVLGILIAFALDNWNEKKKTQTELNNILIEIRENLVRDTSSISNILTERNLDFAAQNRVINAIQDDLPLEDQIRSDLGRCMLKREVPLVSTGFSLLKESKLTTFEDRTLRSKLVEYYEQVVLEMVSEYQDDRYEFENVLLPYLRTNFKDWEFGQSATPINWESIKEDNYFVSALKMGLDNISSTLNSLEDGRNSAVNIIALLDKR
jgi:hypothetical protein